MVAVSDAIRALYSQGDPSGVRQAVVDKTAALVPADSVSYNEVEPSTRKVAVVHDGGYPVALVEKLLPRLTENLHEHPVHRARLATRSTKAMKVTDFMTLRAFERLGLFNEFYRPLGIRHLLAVYLEGTGGGLKAPSVCSGGGRTSLNRTGF